MSDMNAVVDQIKSEGRQREIESDLHNLRQENLQYTRIVMFLNGQEKEDSLHDLALAQQYDRENRGNIANTILDEMGISALIRFIIILI